MTSLHRPANRGRRSIVALAAVGAVVLSTYLAPVATAVTTTDPNGTVTVTADPGIDDTRRTTIVIDGADRPPRRTRRRDHTHGLPAPLRPDRTVAPRRQYAAVDDPTSATVEWAGVACATRYNVSVFVDGKDSVDVVPAPATTYALVEPRPHEDVPHPGQQPQ